MVARVAYATDVLIALSCSAVSIGMKSTAHIVTSSSRHAGMAWGEIQTCQGHHDLQPCDWVCEELVGAP